MDSINRELMNKMDDAIVDNNILRIKELIAENPDIVEYETKSFGNWLHVSARFGTCAIMQFFIEKGIDVNAHGGVSHCGPITDAAFHGREDIVKLLLDNGATLDVDEFTANPLFAAIYNGHMNVVKLLVEAGIDLSATYTLGELDEVDAYEYARQYGQKEIADYLKEKMGK